TPGGSRTHTEPLLRRLPLTGWATGAPDSRVRPGQEAGGRFAASANSLNGSWIGHSETTSRRKNNACVQSMRTWALRAVVGTRLTWYVRCANHAGKPLSRMPYTCATPL